MSVDPPAKLIVIGAGPIGLEAALYARYLGYDVTVLEAGEVCSSVRQWGHVQMFTPFRMNSSPLGRAALKAQDSDYTPPAPEALLTGHEWAERYLLPLTGSDLLSDCIEQHTTVLSIRRSRMLKTELAGSPKRAADTFHVECVSYRPNESEGAEAAPHAEFGSFTAKVVLDCSGTFGQANWGMLNGFQSTFALDPPLLNFGLLDTDGEQREQFAGLHTLLLGSGYSAATNMVKLADLANEFPGGKITWLTRRSAPKNGPIAHIPDDRLPAREALAAKANALASESDSVVTWHANAQVVSLEAAEHDRVRVRYLQWLPGEQPLDDEEYIDDHTPDAFQEHELLVDRVVINAGYRPDTSLFEELQVHLCYATEGPMKLAAALQAKAEENLDCLDQISCGADTIATTEPNFYILGAKSYGRSSNFLFALGLEQIREAFTLIGGRATLNLYESVKHLA